MGEIVYSLFVGICLVLTGLVFNKTMLKEAKFCDKDK